MAFRTVSIAFGIEGTRGFLLCVFHPLFLVERAAPRLPIHEQGWVFGMASAWAAMVSERHIEDAQMELKGGKTSSYM